MAKDQPIGDDTQFGVSNGNTEGYVKREALANALRPLLLKGVLASGSAAPTTAPENGVPPLYVRTGTNPNTLYWWNPLPVPGDWKLIGTVPAALLAAADYPAEIANASRGASGEFVAAAIKALKDLLDPCTVRAATPAEIEAMTDDPALLRLAACYMDDSPAPVGLTGVQLAAILAGGGGSNAAAGLFGALAAGDIVSAVGPYPGGASDKWLVVFLHNTYGASGVWEVAPMGGGQVPGSASSLPYLSAGVAQGGAGLTASTTSNSTDGFRGFAIRLSA